MRAPALAPLLAPQQRFALTLCQKRVALELYIKSHHEELRKEVAASKAAAMTAATVKAVSESNAVADFARQITVTKRECAKWHALAESLTAELESLRAATAAAGASAAAAKDGDIARLTGELAAKAAEYAELRDVYEAEVASAVAAGEAAVALARAEVRAEWDAEKAAGALAEAAAVARAAEDAQAPLSAALEEAGAECTRLRAGLEAAEAGRARVLGELAAARAEAARAASAVKAKEAEVAELEATLEAETEDTERQAARIAALEGELQKSNEDRGVWERRWRVVDEKRAALLEQNLSLKGAIRVFARVRPTLPGEEAAPAAPPGGGVGAAAKSARPTAPSTAAAALAAAAEPLFHFPQATADDATDLVVQERPGKGVGGYGIAEEGKRSEFKTMHRVFPPTAGQDAVFAEVEGLVQSGACRPLLCSRAASLHSCAPSPT